MKFLFAAIVVALSALTLTPAPAQASAAGSLGTNILRSWKTGRCLDTNNGVVYMNICSVPGTNDHQLWEISVENNDAVIRNMVNGWCLATNRPDSVYTTSQECGINSTTRWDGKLWNRPDNVYQTWTFENKNKPGYCLNNQAPDTTPSVADVHLCGGDYQDWKFGF
ncbi:RICIN domain-containing protein [Actinoplanes sp. NPDC051470]|uniref:RICIN domain-containing protein n=1 Tax=Actinoplanes sp. NPDC051470 TaxID=3157224 RepID=UPI0034221654